MALTSAEQLMVENLRSGVADRLQESPLSKAFVTEATLVRYLRARSWKVQDALKMLNTTLSWRMDYKPHLIRWSDVEAEALTGKQFITTHLDNAGHPVLVLRPRHESTKTYERQLAFLVYHLEAASHLADESGAGKMMWLVDFVGYSLSTAPPMTVVRSTLNILQNHYPERLGLALCYLPPRLFLYSWKVISPFVDHNSRQRIQFVESVKHAATVMPKLLDMTKMERCLSGTSEYTYSFEVYSAQMLALEEKRRESGLLL